MSSIQRSSVLYDTFLLKTDFYCKLYVPDTNTYSSGKALTVVYDNLSLYMSVHTVSFSSASLKEASFMRELQHLAHWLAQSEQALRACLVKE